MLGEEFAMQCAFRGDKLFLTGRSSERLELLTQRIKGKYPDCQIITCDCMLDSDASRARLYEFIDLKGVRFSRFIGVAGVDTQMAFEKYTQESALFQMRVNFEANVALTEYLLKKREKDFGILIVSSICGACPMPYFAVYSATKSALVNFYTALRAELKGKGIKVSVLMPGSIPTRSDIIEDIKIQGWRGKLSSRSKEQVVKEALDRAEKNRRIIIPGAFNKMTYALTRIMPQGVVTRFVARNWKNKEKNAFCEKKAVYNEKEDTK